MRTQTVALALLLTSAVPAAAAQAPAGDGAAFVTALKGACSRGDKTAMAGLVQYPLAVATSGMRIPIANRDALLQSYDAVFTPAVCRSVSAGEVKPTDGGLIVGGVEARRVAGGFKVVRVTAAAVPAGGGESGTAFKSRTNERIIPRPGRPIPVRGALGQGQRESFVVNVQQGQLLSVRIDEVKAEEVTAKIVEADSGTPVDARAGGGFRAWNGRVKKSGDYRIEVARTGGAGESLGYTLTVQVK